MTPRANSALLTSGLILAMLASCGWEKVQGIGRMVWSDDDVEQAYVHASWEVEKGLFGVPEGAKKRNFRHRLILQKPDGSDRRELYGEAPGTGGRFLYFMRSKGYVLFELANDVGRQSEKITLDGQRQRVGDSYAMHWPCDDFEMIPSPEGDIFAAIHHLVPMPSPSTPTGPVSTACGDGTIAVDFFDATTLNPLGAHFEWDVRGIVEAVWSPAGELFVVSGNDAVGIDPDGGPTVLTGDTHAWVVDPYSGPAIAEMPSCLYPKTTSSNVSGDGTKIGPGAVDNPVQVVATDVTTFGCQ